MSDPSPATRLTRGDRRWIAVGVTLSVLVLGALLAAEIADEVAGCGSVDPTDPANYSAVSITNDTTRTVVVDDCVGDECQIADLPATLRPGETYDDHAACGVSGADMTSWRIRSAAGDLLGYVAVDTPRKTDGLTFRVSWASRDRRTPTSPG